MADLILSNPNIFNMIINFEFYFYECESINDRGWGSGWRCFQTFLKTAKNYSEKKFEEKFENLKNFDLSFENLFITYGNRIKLDKIFLKKIQEKESLSVEIKILPEYLINRIYAPFETQHGWAEPFILDLINFDLGGKGNIYLLNGYVEYAFTPFEIFEKIVRKKNLCL